MKFKITDILPDPERVYIAQGASKNTPIQTSIHQITEETLEMFSSLVQAEALVKPCSFEDFETIFAGEGKNADNNPLESIFPEADHLVLFALTMGNEVSLKIQDLFQHDDFAPGVILDTIASLAADKAVDVLENFLFYKLRKDSGSDNLSVLSYSPGYCGWDISGQKKLFQFVQPEKIGISLNDSYLMTPLKSVSGVLVAGKKEIHVFLNNYPFCRDCKNRSCKERIKTILKS